MQTKVYGTFMFAEGKGLWKQLSGSVTTVSEGTIKGFFFQQDGKAPHFANVVRDGRTDVRQDC
jgi:Na+-transporting NADH:ubiquinone oxidoreductase subunit NqrC